MMFRAIGCCVALILGLLLSLYVTAAPAKAEPEKPLDIMKFMREQAASTRKAAPTRPVHVSGRPPHAAHHRITVAKHHSGKPQPVVDAMSYAAQPEPALTVEVVSGSELNALDRAVADAAPPETTGIAPAAELSVQEVVAEAFNEIDRKAAELPAPALSTSGTAAQASWPQRVWSGVASTFGALTAAVRALI